MAKTPYMCTACGKVHQTLAGARTCDHVKEEEPKQRKITTTKKTEDKKLDI